MQITEQLYFFPGRGFASNSYAIQIGEAIYLVDPNLQDEEITYFSGRNLQAIFATHGHFDHQLSTTMLMEDKPNLVFYMQEEDQCMASNPMANASGFFGMEMCYAHPNANLTDQEILTLEDGFTIEVLHTPGHSPGSVCLLFAQGNEALALFTGDTFFSTSIGRSDLYQGSETQLMESLRKVRKFAESNAFSEDLLILSGHGPVTTWGETLASNPWL